MTATFRAKLAVARYEDLRRPAAGPPPATAFYSGAPLALNVAVILT